MPRETRTPGRRPASRSSRTGRTRPGWRSGRRRPRRRTGRRRRPDRGSPRSRRVPRVDRRQHGRREPEARAVGRGAAEKFGVRTRTIPGAADRRPISEVSGTGPRPAARPPAPAARGSGRRRSAGRGSGSGRGPARRCRRRRTAPPAAAFSRSASAKTITLLPPSSRVTRFSHCAAGHHALADLGGPGEDDLAGVGVLDQPLPDDRPPCRAGRRTRPGRPASRASSPSRIAAVRGVSWRA